MATLTSGDGLHSIDANLTGPDSSGKYTVLLQKPVNPPWAGDQINVELDDQIIWTGTWTWKDQIGPT